MRNNQKITLKKLSQDNHTIVIFLDIFPCHFVANSV
jgi:hypothetical protein